MIKAMWKAVTGRGSLRNQILTFTIACTLIAMSLYSALAVFELVASGRTRIEEYRAELLARRKEELKSYVEIAMNTIEGLAPDQAMATVKKMRYGEAGYIWINDTTAPIPKMLMHPTIPSLDGRVMDDPKYDCAMGRGQNLFVAAVEVCQAGGEGFVDYLWPKPTRSGLTQEAPKLSYVKLYRPLGWVLGTGVYIDDIDALVARERRRVRAELRGVVTKTAAAAVVIIGLLFLGARRFFVKSIGVPLKRVAVTMRQADTDLTVRIPIGGDTEIDELAGRFNAHTESLQGVIKDASSTVTAVQTYARDIAVSVEEQAAVAAEQSAAVSEITATMEEFSASSTQIAENARSVVEIATKTWEDTRTGARAIETVIASMNEIHTDNEGSIREIVELGRKSKEIAKVMQIINTIADQTKLIAFNAALEAASAGDAGKRFGVVAVEIRRLADSVMASTGEIETKVGEIQEAINRLVIASEKGSKGIRAGMDRSSQTAGLLKNMVEAAQSTTDAAKQISLSTQQQKTASNQVVVALKEIMAGSKQTSNAIQQISAITRQMTQLSDSLGRAVATFKVS
jgi:methyl-accepting chemotaxis protein